MFDTKKVKNFFKGVKEKAKAKYANYKKKETFKKALAPLRMTKKMVELPKTGKKVEETKIRNSVNKKQAAVEKVITENLNAFGNIYGAMNRDEQVKLGKVAYKNMNQLEREQLKVQGEILKRKQAEEELYNEYHNPFDSRSDLEQSIYNEAQEAYAAKKMAAATNDKANPFAATSLTTSRMGVSPSFRNVFYETKHKNYEKEQKQFVPSAPRLEVNPRKNRVKAMLKRENTPEPNLSPPPIPSWAADINNDPRTPSPVRETFAPMPTSAWNYGR